jgi:hypothetical protein
MGQVARHRPFAEEERGGDLSVRAAFGDEGGDVELRGAQALNPLAATDPAQLPAGRGGPACGAEVLEACEGRLQGGASGSFLESTASDLAEREVGAGAPERISGRPVRVNRLFEQ